MGGSPELMRDHPSLETLNIHGSDCSWRNFTVCIELPQISTLVVFDLIPEGDEGASLDVIYDRISHTQGFCQVGLRMKYSYVNRMTGLLGKKWSLSKMSSTDMSEKSSTGTP